jgi:hypothetical protein
MSGDGQDVLAYAKKEIRICWRKELIKRHSILSSHFLKINIEQSQGIV